MAAVANGGVLWKPRMVLRVKAPDGTPLASEAEVEENRLNVAPVVFDFLREALANVVANGTGKGAQVPGVPIAGKTGTAQTREFKSDADRKRRDQDNAWFASFAPVDDPRFVVVVFAERAGLGGHVAAPIAREIYRAIFLEKVASAGGPTG
jgi:cell division protein FtsI/penicillin-binding protein 2